MEILDHAWNDIVLLEDFNKGFAISGLLVQGLFKENDTREVGEGIGRGEEQLSESLAVGLDVIDIDAG